jgi:hypothetical protein
MTTHYECGAIDTPFIWINNYVMACPCKAKEIK